MFSGMCLTVSLPDILVFYPSEFENTVLYLTAKRARASTSTGLWDKINDCTTVEWGGRKQEFCPFSPNESRGKSHEETRRWQEYLHCSKHIREDLCRTANKRQRRHKVTLKVQQVVYKLPLHSQSTWSIHPSERAGAEAYLSRDGWVLPWWHSRGGRRGWGRGCGCCCSSHLFFTNNLVLVCDTYDHVTVHFHILLHWNQTERFIFMSGNGSNRDLWCIMVLWLRPLRFISQTAGCFVSSHLKSSCFNWSVLWQHRGESTLVFPLWCCWRENVSRLSITSKHPQRLDYLRFDTGLIRTIAASNHREQWCR